MTGTRVVPALTVTGWGSTPVPVARPRIFCVSVSIFDSSPRTTGMTFPTTSSDGTPGYPAPESAWSVETITCCRPNGRNGASARASTMVEQLGLVTMQPDHPLAALCSVSKARWSALTSGITSGTTGSMRWLRALLTTTCPARANSASTSPATEASRPENSSRGARPGVTRSTVISAMRSGRAAGRRHGVASR